MNGEVIRLGRSIRVTLTSHEAARLAEISGLIRYFLDPDLRTRWSEPLHFPEDVVSETNLLILVRRKRIYKKDFDVIHFVRMCHYLLIEENEVFDLLDINCYKCRVMGRKCNYNHHHSDGCYDDYALIPVLYFTHFIAKWEWMYQRLLKFLKLRFFEVDESWPYRFFKKKVRDMFRSRERWYDDNHFWLGEWRRQGCISRDCKLCQMDPPDSDGDGWT